MKKEPFDYNFDQNYVDAVAKYTLQSVYRGAWVRTALRGHTSYMVRKNLLIVRQMVKNPEMIKTVDFGKVFYKLFGENTGPYSSLYLYKKYLGGHRNEFYKQMVASHFVESAPLIARIRARSLIGR